MTVLEAQPDADASPMSIAAEAAALVYLGDAEPGIRRRRSGTGFTYRDAAGRRIAHRDTLERIARLAIPPAWTEVWISPDPDGHIQATGRDVKGRKQYRYHERWNACRDEVKFASLAGFARSLPSLRGKVEADLRLRGLPFEKVVATVVWLLDNAMIRVGNATYARENGSFGLTTLRSRHVAVEGATLRFAFRGKSGQEWKLKIADRRIARIVKGVQELPGQHLFQYIDEEGGRRSIASQDVNDYIRDHAGESFTSKHFRTWGGTVRAAEILAETPLPPTKRETAIVLNAVVDEVAAKLGNTRSVCRRCYIHPLVLQDWSEGRLAQEMDAIRRRFRRTPAGLDRDEALVMRWLEATG